MQAFEYFTQACIGLVLQHVDGLRSPFSEAHPGYVLLELADTVDEVALNALVENVIGAALEAELCSDAVVSASLAQLESIWRLREEISEAQRMDGPHLKHDISVPIEALPNFMAVAQQRVETALPGARLFVFGHFGDGNLHYNVSRPADTPANFFAEHPEAAEAITDAVLEEVALAHGSISAEHGIGQLKRHHFQQFKSPLEQRLMQAIKAVFDPHGIMNPGKLL